MDRLQMFGQNIRLLIGILLVLGLGGLLAIAVWTGLNVWHFRRKQSRAERDMRKGKLDRDGRPLPPKRAGICEQCHKAGEVYHLPDGKRSCKECYSRVARVTPHVPN